MCGSGTLLIEAAMIALNIAPGIHRKEFAFEKWIDFDRELLDTIYNDESNEKEFNFKCYGSDISDSAIDIARKNVRSAGLNKYINLQVLPFQQYTEAPKAGVLVTNPPYGERISSRDLIGLYSMIGERLKHVFKDYRAWILSYKDECFDKIGLRPAEKIKLMNGPLECEYRCYEIFEGKNRDYKKAINEDYYNADRRNTNHKNDDRKKTLRPATKSNKTDRPDRRFAAAHANDRDDDFGKAAPNRKILFSKKTKSEFGDSEKGFNEKGERKKFITKRGNNKKDDNDF